VTHDTTQPARRLLVLGVVAHAPDADSEIAAYYAELERLADSAGARVVERRVQVRARTDPRTYAGPGFVDAIVRRVAEPGEGEEPIDGVLLAEEVPPRALANLAERLPVPVEDRTQLILGIFADRARSTEGRLQVELARLAYALPRLAGARQGLGRQRGGVGLRGGVGETALELDRRRTRRRIAELRREVETLRADRSSRRDARGTTSRVALVGYTNAGKTTLLGALAGREEGGRDRLFDTLDPATRRIRHRSYGEAVLVDTVGFVRDLPPGLLEAFEATLAEVREADALVHVVDATAPDALSQVDAVHTILARIGADTVPEILVASHARCPGARLGALDGALGVDVPAGVGIEALHERIGAVLGRERETVVVDLPADRWDVVSFARERGEVELVPTEDGGVRMTARLAAEDAGRLRHRLGRG